MNIWLLIGGIVCLVLSAILVVLNLTLPPESLMYMVGDVNMPWLPPVVFAVAGIIMLAISLAKRKPVEQAPQVITEQDAEKVALNKKLESAAWGFFLIMLGGFALVPDHTIPKGAWSIGVGVIMLGLNAARYFYKIRMSGFTTFLGILALLGGTAELIWHTSLDGALLLIILGAYLIFKPWFEKRKLFGKAEQS